MNKRDFCASVAAMWAGSSVPGRAFASESAMLVQVVAKQGPLAEIARQFGQDAGIALKAAGSVIALQVMEQPPAQARAREMLQRLISQQRAVALFGSHLIDWGDATPLLRQGRIPVIAPVGMDDQQRDALRGLAFVPRARYDRELQVIVQHIATIGGRNVALFQLDLPSAKSHADTFAALAKAAGLVPRPDSRLRRDGLNVMEEADRRAGADRDRRPSPARCSGIGGRRSRAGPRRSVALLCHFHGRRRRAAGRRNDTGDALPMGLCRPAEATLSRLGKSRGATWDTPHSRGTWPACGGSTCWIGPARTSVVSICWPPWRSTVGASAESTRLYSRTGYRLGIRRIGPDRRTGPIPPLTAPFEFRSCDSTISLYLMMSALYAAIGEGPNCKSARMFDIFISTACLETAEMQLEPGVYECPDE